MDRDFKNFIVLGIFLFVIAVFWYVYEYSKTIPPLRTFSITAEGKEVVIPNIAEFKIGLITEGKNLTDIQKENSNKFNKLIEFLKKQGINEKDIRTEVYSITPKYKYDKESKIVGYSINQTLSVKVRDINKIGEILSGAVQNGANNIYGPNFTIDEISVYLDKAREKAIKSAQEKAQKIAKIMGFKLGRVINISEIPSEVSPILLKGVSTEMGGLPSPSIEPGSQEVKINVTITYEIK